MSDELTRDEAVTSEVNDRREEFEYVEMAPAHEPPLNVLEQTLSRGASGVDVSGVQRGAGHTGISITPSLSMPKKRK
jgi:hypothetical protein